ncbi:MAG: hypothetical protein AAF962_26315 [Actinomycetota bacterium]
MPNLRPQELLIILGTLLVMATVAVVLALVIATVIRRTTGTGSPVAAAPPTVPPMPAMPPGVRCSTCGSVERAGSRFCSSCGAALVVPPGDEARS